MASSYDSVNRSAGTERPSLFAQFDDKYPAGGLAPAQSSRRRARPLATRRTYDPQRLWATVLSCLALALAVAGWQWCLILTSDDRLAAVTSNSAVTSNIAETSNSAVTSNIAETSNSAVTSNIAETKRSAATLARQKSNGPKGIALAVADLSSHHDALSELRDSFLPQSPPQEDPPAISEEFPEPRSVALAKLGLEPPRPVRGERPQPLAGSIKPVDRRLTKAFDEEATPSTEPATLADLSVDPAKIAPETGSEIADSPAVRAPVFEKAAKLRGPQPTYPASAARTGRAGSVLLEARINVKGAVRQITTLESADADFEQAARQALSAWQFEPAQRDGVAVEDVHHVRFRFEAPKPQTVRVTRPPVRVLAPLPSYPPAAFAANTHGEVKLRVRVDETGDVDGVEIVEGLPHGVNDAVLAAVGQWKFQPALQNGQPVAAYEDLTFRF